MGTATETTAALATLAPATILSANANAEESRAAFSKIRETGAISLGVRESSVPLSCYDEQQRAIGYWQERRDHALANFR